MSATPNLGIALLQQAQSLKYVTVNDAFDAFDGAIAGVFTQAMANANQTPSTPTAMENMVFKCTGALTANRELILPNSPKLYVIHNLTTGGFSIVVQTASPSATVTVGSGAQLVYCDGANNFYAVA
jgi:hypothetical protein